MFVVDGSGHYWTLTSASRNKNILPPCRITQTSLVRRSKTGRDAITAPLRPSLASSSEKIVRFGEEKLDQLMTRFDGQKVTKTAMLQFALAREMRHCGQLTVYQRLLGIESALTERFRRSTTPKR
jgi:uncharacterized damage-inducible protein DinB